MKIDKLRNSLVCLNERLTQAERVLADQFGGIKAVVDSEHGYLAFNGHALVLGRDGRAIPSSSIAERITAANLLGALVGKLDDEVLRLTDATLNTNAQLHSWLESMRSPGADTVHNTTKAKETRDGSEDSDARRGVCGDGEGAKVSASGVWRLGKAG